MFTQLGSSVYLDKLLFIYFLIYHVNVVGLYSWLFSQNARAPFVVNNLSLLEKLSALDLDQINDSLLCVAYSSTRRIELDDVHCMKINSSLLAACVTHSPVHKDHVQRR